MNCRLVMETWGNWMDLLSQDGSLQKWQKGLTYSDFQGRHYVSSYYSGKLFGIGADYRN